MTRLSIEITSEQHRAIKASAALEDMAMKDFVLHRLFHTSPANIFTKMPSKGKSALAISKQEKNYSAGHPDCPLCQKYAVKNRYNTKTERNISLALKSKNKKTYASADEMFKALGLRT